MNANKHYFDHAADIGIIGQGNSLEESFIDAAKAVFALMGDLTHVHPKQSITITFEEEDIELAFVTWLNLLIAQAQANQLIFSHFDIKKQNHHWSGKAQGESWRDDMERGIDVKGATLTMLSVKSLHGKWRAQCVV